MGRKDRPKRIGFYQTVKKEYPMVYGLITSKPTTLWLPKACIGLAYGILVAFAIHYLVIGPMALPVTFRVLMGFGFGAFISVGCAISIQMRCIFGIAIPTFATSTGRTYLWAYIFAMLLAGPGSNLWENAGEVVRSLRCTMALKKNHTKDRADLLYKPLNDIMQKMKEQAGEIHKKTDEMKKAFKPVAFEVEDQGEVDGLKDSMADVDFESGGNVDRGRNIDRKYHISGRGDEPGPSAEDLFGRKMEYRCEEVYTVGVNQCKRVFRKTYITCKNKIPHVGVVLCSPLKLTFLCNIMKLLPKLLGFQCNAKKAIPKGFGRMFGTAKSSGDDLDNNFDVSMQYQIIDGVTHVNRITTDDIEKAIEHNFAKKRSYFDSISSFASKFLCLLFIRIILNAKKYHMSYVTQFTFDNKYINNYFKWIDARRAYQGKRTLLPLKKLEKEEVIEGAKCSFDKEEKKRVMIFTILNVCRVLICALILFFDRILFEVLHIIRENSGIDYRQRGYHWVGVTVLGDGPMATVMASMMEGFNKEHKIDSFSTNRRCLPDPRVTPHSDYVFMCFLISLSFALVMCEGYFLRLRHIIAGFFYPRRDKRRTLHMYNDMLRRRKGYLKEARQKVREQAKKHELEHQMGFWATVKYKSPCCKYIFKCLPSRFQGKKKCVICDEEENRHFILCGCDLSYCEECWDDVKERCYGCENKSFLETESDEELAKQYYKGKGRPDPYMQLTPALMAFLPLWGGKHPDDRESTDKEEKERKEKIVQLRKKRELMVMLQAQRQGAIAQQRRQRMMQQHRQRMMMMQTQARMMAAQAAMAAQPPPEKVSSDSSDSESVTSHMSVSLNKSKTDSLKPVVVPTKSSLDGPAEPIDSNQVHSITESVGAPARQLESSLKSKSSPGSSSSGSTSSGSSSASGSTSSS